jgi:hypothetical protein
MRQAQTLRVAAWIALAGWAGTSGCTHNHYYGNAVPLCPQPATVTTYGPVCEVPTQVAGGTLLAPGTGQTTVVATAPRPSRVVVSEPRDGVPLLRGRGRLGWRQSDPDTLATTRVEGDLGDDSVNR